MKKLILTGIMLLMVLGVSGCRNNNDEANSIKVGYFNNVTHAQALLMKSEKSLENTFGKDINVKWTAFNAGPAEVEALFAGDIDIGYIGPVPAISANVKSNGDVQILSRSKRWCYFDSARGGTNIRCQRFCRKNSGNPTDW